jgi:hypothetical protein
LRPKPFHSEGTMRIIIHYFIAIFVLTIYGGQV